MGIAITISVILLILVALIIYAHNRLIAKIMIVNNNKNQINIQLERRFKLFLSLIDIVKKQTDDDQTALKEVLVLHHQAHQAVMQGNVKARMIAENQISQIADHLQTIFLHYPFLKTNQNALQLEEEIKEIQNKLNYAKEAYNKSIDFYYAEKNSFLRYLIIRMFPSTTDKTFEYWKS